MILFGIGAIGGIIGCGSLGYASTRKRIHAMENIKYHVNIELNRKYYSQNIRWQFVENSDHESNKYYDFNMNAELICRPHQIHHRILVQCISAQDGDTQSIDIVDGIHKITDQPLS